jgi:arylsulfatase
MRYSAPAGFTLTADVTVPATGANGVPCALGDHTGGFILRAADGRLVFACSRAGDVDRVAAPDPLPPGRTTVGVRYDAKARTFTLLHDGQPIAQTRLGGDFPVAFQHGGTGLCVGHDRGLPVEEAYRPPHPFTGTVHTLVIDTVHTLAPDLTDEIRTALHSDRGSGPWRVSCPAGCAPLSRGVGAVRRGSRRRSGR